jgi:hypothetical protein
MRKATLIATALAMITASVNAELGKTSAQMEPRKPDSVIPFKEGYTMTWIGKTVTHVGYFINGKACSETMTSPARFKEDITPMAKASEALFALKPVSFRYKKAVDPEDPEHKSEFGLVAEHVEKVNPDLIVRDKEGKPYSVRYDQIKRDVAQ